MAEEDVEHGVIESEVSVSAYTSSGCSTSVVIGLSKQIADEMSCMNPNGLVRFSTGGNMQITSSAVLPYLHSAARTNLQRVAASRVVKINSAFRTVAQQYLLYRWKQLGRCGISAAARPGRSNHEGGRALDVSNWSSLVSAMGSRGWAHNVPGDEVHFEHLSSPDMRGADVRAFQRLWNRNNPGDKIAEDGAYGPQTEARLRAAPATGFALGAQCTTRLNGPEIVMVEGPDKLAPGMRAHYAITVVNDSTTTWPATTRIAVSDGASSQFYDPTEWDSPTQVSTLGTQVPSGERRILDVEVLAPMVSEETPVYSQFALVGADGTQYGMFDLAAIVTPNGDHEDSAEAHDHGDENAEASYEATGGCSTSGSSGAGGALALAGLALVIRRRRRA